MDLFLYQIEKFKSPLHRAALLNDIGSLKLSLSKSTKVDTITKHFHVTPLHCAAKRDNLEAVRLLVRAGANLECKTSDGYTALDLAARYYRLKVCEFLIESGANVNGYNMIYGTHLHFACSDIRFGGLAKPLIEHGANINARNSRGATPLHEAAATSFRIAQLLVEKRAYVNAIDHEGQTPLYKAILKGQTDIVDLLINRWSTLEMKDNHHNTPLLLATKRGQTGIVQILLESGADVDCTNEKNMTPLHIAAAGNLCRIAQLLIDNGASLEVKTYKDGNTPLHLAVIYGNSMMVKFLLNRGANVNAKSILGIIPLHKAAKIDNIEIAKLLLDRGAYCDSKLDGDQDTGPREVASQANKLEIVSILDSTIKMLNAIVNDDIEEVERYIIDKCVVNARESYRGNASLHYVKSVRVLRCLLKHGACYNMKNKEGKTLLDKTNDKNISKLLELIGQLYDGTKAGDKDVIEKLRNLKGEDLEAVLRARNDENRTLIQVAAAYKHDDIAGELTKMLKKQHSPQQ